MKGPSWADQTAAEEEEEDQRRAEAQRNRPVQQPPSTRAPQQQAAGNSGRAPASAYAPATASISFASRAGAPAPSPVNTSGDVRGAGGGRTPGGGERDLHRSNQDYRGPASGTPGRSPYGGANANTAGRDTRGNNAGYGGRDNNAGYGGRDNNAGYGGRDNRGGSQSVRDEPQWPRGDQQRSGPGPRIDNRDNRGPAAGGRGGQRSGDNTPVVRETGIITMVKDGFGFLRSADREGEVFFHFSEFPHGSPPKKGDELSFRVQADGQRARASQMELLPPGSVVFEAIVSQSVRGVIVREMRGQLSAAAARKGGKRMSLADSLSQGRAEAYGGKIKRLDDAGAASPAPASSDAASAAPAEETYEFSERDLADPNILLFPGDIVAFDVFVEKKSSRRGATKVTLVEANPVGRERGKIVTVKEGFGFISVEQEIDEEEDAAPAQQGGDRFGRGHGRDQSGRDQLFFHNSEMIDPRYTPQVGDELSFRVDRSPAEGNKVSAQRIQLLPKGSLNSRDISRETLHGTITKEITFETIAAASPVAPVAATTTDAPATTDATVEAAASPLAVESTPQPASSPSNASSSRPPARKAVPGIITYVDASGASVELPYRPSDVQLERRAPALLLKGDTVSFHLLTLTLRAGVTKRATQIQVNQSGWSKLAREQGIVSQVRDGGFCFVDCVSRADKIFLHSSQLRGGVAGAARADERGSATPNKETLFVGLEVEFNLAEETPGRLSAVRALTLAPGSVKFEEVLPMTFTARISRGIKRREVNRNLPKAGTDSSSFSKNDLRRDQAAQQARGELASRGEGRGEKGEVNNFALADGSAPLPDGFSLPALASFFDVDVIDPVAAGLDLSALVIGDTVTLQLQRHKRTHKLSATKVQLTAIASEGREQGQVSRLKEGLGYLVTPSKLTPIAFFLRDAPKGVAVGDCFAFNISEPNAGGKREREQRGERGPAPGDDKPHAVRMTPLPAGSVEVEKIDRTMRFRGYIAAVPERPSGGNRQSQGGKPQSSSNKPGQVVRLINMRDAMHVSTTLASMWTHPAGWPVTGVEATPVTEYNPALVHPAFLVQEATAGAADDTTTKFAFTFGDIAGNNFLSKGDLLDFYIAERAQPSVGKRAVDITLTPLQGIVERIDFAAGEQLPRAYTGTIIVVNPQAAHTEETFVFSSKNVLASSPVSSSPTADGSSSSAPSPPPSTELAVGDLVEFTDIVLNSEKKKREAKSITRTKGAKGVRPGTRRVPGTAIVYASRFARGPDKEGIGFAPRRGAEQVAAPEA